MTYSKYNVLIKIGNRTIVYNLVTDSVITDMDKDFESLMELKNSLDSQNLISNKLSESRFVVNSDIEEKSYILELCRKAVNSLDELTVVISTTLSCNFGCAYCNQAHHDNAMMSDETLLTVVEFIRNRYVQHPYKRLYLSFFGGEPMLNPRCIEKAITLASEFAKENGIELSLSFTTNGSVLADKMIELLRPYKVSFQITVDGNPETHNRNRPFKNGKPSYEIIMGNIERILCRLPYSKIVLRLNYDQNIKPDNYYSLLNSVKNFQQNRISISLNKIFQIDGATIPVENFLSTVALFNRFGFPVNSSTICRSICSASFLNYAFFRYDGKRIMCSSTSDISNDYEDNLINITEERKNALSYMPDECGECIFLAKCMSNCIRRKIGKIKCIKYLPDELAAKLYVKQKLLKKHIDAPSNC